MKSQEIRDAFLSFFEQKGHTIVPSSSLVPGNDPTLLFTNAGMVQFKEVFLEEEKRDYSRATTVQRCVRAGGKHNDLENVGYTARHHTFFEMLGNFSFGDYFKREAIQYAWEFLTQTVGLPKEKLWVTVYEDDTEAAEIWLNEIGVPADRFTKIGDKPGKAKYESDNFWAMGDTGPCGPCSEIFYDHGDHIPGGPPGSPDEDGDRYIEIWNLVFMQYNRTADGEMHPLPKPSVDTGMGLERLAAILQDVHSNYEIDLFQTLIGVAAEAIGCKDHEHNSLKVIADHIRSCAFLAVDGVVPSNEGRGYVMRRIIRRAIRHGYKLGQNDPFFHKLVAPLVTEMGAAYPELKEKAKQAEQVLLREEERFAETLEQGMKILEEALADLASRKQEQIPGSVIFQLYDTYGFPVDLTNDIARERSLMLDLEGYEVEMNQQRERARAAGGFKVAQGENLDVQGETPFTGYDSLFDQAEITALFVEGKPVEKLEERQQGIVVLNQTPFYAESGGQVGDTGVLEVSVNTARFTVEDTQKQKGETFLHIGKLESGEITVGDKVKAHVFSRGRKASARNHSATHLAHAALRQVLGDHVQQKGSLVNADRLRFDFAHFEPMTAAQIHEVEQLVNEQILASHPVETKVMNIEEAKAAGAMALFGEKYGDDVRVVKMDAFSTELCGGTHVSGTGEIGMFRVLSESGIAAGVRRMEAVTGEGALQWADAGEAALQQIASLVKGTRDTVGEKVESLLEQNRKLEKELERLKSKLASSAGGDLATQAEEIDGVKVLAAKLEGTDSKTLRTMLDKLKEKLGSAAILLATAEGEKVTLAAGVTKDVTKKLKAGDWIREIAPIVGGKGGGRPDMAQGGGSDPSKLDAALQAAQEWAKTQLVG